MRAIGEILSFPLSMGSYAARTAIKRKWCLLKLTRKRNSVETVRNIVKEATSGSKDEIFAYT